AVRAAVDAEAVLAFDRAAMLYRRALALVDPADPEVSGWRERLGVALANAGRGADAAEAFVAAAQGTEPGGADLRRRAAEQLLRAGHVDRGLDLIDAVLREQDLPPLRQVSWAVPRLLLERVKLAIRGRQAEPAELTSAKNLRLACCWSACVGAAMTSPVTAAAYQTRHLRLALEAGDPRRIALGLAMEAIGASAAGPPARRAHAILAEADRWATRVNSPETAGYARMARATIAFLCGEWRNALTHADEAERVFSRECVGCAWEVGTAQRVSLTCLWHMGRIRELAARTARALEDAEERGDLYASTQLRTVLQPNIFLMHHDLPAARAEIERAAAGLARTAVHLQHWQHMQASALVELYAGTPERAVALIDATLPAVKRAFLFRVLAVRMFTYFVHGTALVGAAARAGKDPTLIRRARQVRRALTRETGGAHAADLLGAQLAELAGRTDRAVELYQRARRGFLAVDTNLLALTCQIRLARLTGDDAAAAAAHAALASEDIARPDRLCAMLAPVSQ
ncbi:MAG TPA: hypothetical protein VML75_08935, partial [Kofleriaceae bacterium]|nr:hypothetical protein [Kofleriaceae bacterium]